MNSTTVLALAGVMLVAITLTQWIALRSRYLTGLTEQRTRHAQQMQSAAQYIDQAKRQIAKLQMDLGHARSQLARHAARQAEMIASRQRIVALAPTLQQEIAHAPGMASDGFADTLPAPQYPHDPSLLATYPAHR